MFQLRRAQSWEECPERLMPRPSPPCRSPPAWGRRATYARQSPAISLAPFPLSHLQERGVVKYEEGLVKGQPWFIELFRVCEPLV